LIRWSIGALKLLEKEGFRELLGLREGKRVKRERDGS
jgi:hypothetical protein